MGCWAIVPIKAAESCKTRLADGLSPARRRWLARGMLDRVLRAALASPAVDRVLLVSPEAHVLPAGVQQVFDRGCGLNEALEVGRDAALAGGATRLLVLAADLPLLAAADIEALVGAGGAGCLALAVDRHRGGTNALCLEPLVPFTFAFGTDSAARHADEAARRGLRLSRVATPGLEFDVDTQADMARLRRRRVA